MHITYEQTVQSPFQSFTPSAIFFTATTSNVVRAQYYNPALKLGKTLS